MSWDAVDGFPKAGPITFEAVFVLPQTSSSFDLFLISASGGKARIGNATVLRSGGEKKLKTVPSPAPASEATQASPGSVPGIDRLAVDAAVQAAKLVRQPPPAYPILAKKARVQGAVRFRALIGRDGTVESLKLVSGHALLVEAALQAAQQYAYEPTLVNGVPVKVVTEIEIKFSLER